MGATLSLADVTVQVTPGSTATSTLSVRNNGSVVDQFDLELLGESAAWIHAEPASVSLFPGAEEQVQLVFHPPKDASVSAGPCVFAVKANSHQDPTGSAVEEGTVTVDAFDNRAAELVPRTSRGKRRGVHEVAIDNRGNQPMKVALFGSDKDQRVRVECVPPRLIIPPGQAQFAKVTVTPVERFWRGSNRTFPFTVEVVDVVEAPVERPTETEQANPEAELPPPGGPTTAFGNPMVPPPLPGAGATAVLTEPIAAPATVADPVKVDGSMVQEAMLPPWLLKALLAALAVLLLLLILWFTLVKPQIKTSAKEAVQPIDERLDAAGIPTVAPAAAGGAAAKPPAGGGGGAAAETTTTTAAAGSSGGGAASDFGPPFITRLEATSASATSSYQPPSGTSFALTDMVFQNPQGDTGRITLSRGSTVLYEFSLENFRSHDLHLISPVIVADSESLTLSINCTTPGPGAAGCADSVSLSGFQG